jgi:hypothetical protein
MRLPVKLRGHNGAYGFGGYTTVERIPSPGDEIAAGEDSLGVLVEEFCDDEGVEPHIVARHLTKPF